MSLYLSLFPSKSLQNGKKSWQNGEQKFHGFNNGETEETNKSIERFIEKNCLFNIRCDRHNYFLYKTDS